MELSIAFTRLIEIGELIGVENVTRDGLWRYQIDEHWKFQVNTSKQELDGVPPFNAAIFYKDMPAALIDPTGGSFVIGTYASESIFIEAADKHISELKNDNVTTT